MDTLKDILYKAGSVKVQGDTAVSVKGLTADSRAVQKDWIFIAVKGTQVDGHLYIDKAIELGASVIICMTIPFTFTPNVTYVQVEDSSHAVGICAANFYDNPSENIKIVGITGTNGKTTVTTLLFNLFTSLGYTAGLISTVVNKIGNREIPSTHTTPDPVSLQALLAEMVAAGSEYCFMEVSSHALVQKRTIGIDFTGALFTNISHDHLDYHSTFKEYIYAKKLLFDGLGKNAFAIFNEDDQNGEVMVQNCNARKRSFALKTMADYKARILENLISGLHLSIDGNEMYSQLIGQFNASNLLAVYAISQELQQEKFDVLTKLSSLSSVEGRFQQMTSEKHIMAVVDYAHTPDALMNVLKTIKTLRTGNEQVITVVGCGGNRDKTKRPEMAKIAAEFSDKVVLTSDNPRSEEPDEIIKDMAAGLDPVALAKTLQISNRKEAIKLACTLAQTGDIILIAGKGHEKYQDIKGVKHPFDDLETVETTFKLLNK